jgi:hypothetical protein
MDTIEEEFEKSLRALMIRYGIKLVKTVKGFGSEAEVTYVFDNTTTVYLDIEELLKK